MQGGGLEMGGRRERDGRVRLREGRYLKDGWIGAEHGGDRVKGGRDGGESRRCGRGDG